MNDQPPPEPKKAAPERDPARLETWPALRATKDYPEITDRLHNPPAPKPERPLPEPERKANPKDLEHRPPEPDPRNRPTIQGLGMGGSYGRPPPARAHEPTPEPQPEPKKQPEPVPDILAEARRRIAERGQADEARERPSGRILELRRPGDGQQP